MSVDDTITILERLVAFDTVSSRSNAELIDWVANRLDDLGVRAFVQHGDEPGKANLFATLGPEGPRRASCFPAIPTWCRSPARTGRAIPSFSPRATAGCTAGAAPT